MNSEKKSRSDEEQAQSATKSRRPGEQKEEAKEEGIGDVFVDNKKISTADGTDHPRWINNVAMVCLIADDPTSFTFTS